MRRNTPFILFAIKNGEAVNSGEHAAIESNSVCEPWTIRIAGSRCSSGPVAYFDKLATFSTYYPINGRIFIESTDGRLRRRREQDLLYNGPFIISRLGARRQSLKIGEESELLGRRIASETERTIDFAYITIGCQCHAESLQG